MDFKYPYTDFHELNLDWFLAEFKKLTEEWLQMQQGWADEQQAFQDLKEYVDYYFVNLDVQQEINNKLDGMALNGQLGSIMSPYVTAELPSVVAAQLAPVVAAQLAAVVASILPSVLATQLPDAVSGEAATWLAAHIDPGSGYAIDKSLTAGNAAADAEVVGIVTDSLLGDTTSDNYFSNRLQSWQQGVRPGTAGSYAVYSNVKIPVVDAPMFLYVKAPSGYEGSYIINFYDSSNIYLSNISYTFDTVYVRNLHTLNPSASYALVTINSGNGAIPRTAQGVLKDLRGYIGFHEVTSENYIYPHFIPKLAEGLYNNKDYVKSCDFGFFDTSSNLYDNNPEAWNVTYSYTKYMLTDQDCLAETNYITYVDKATIPNKFTTAGQLVTRELDSSNNVIATHNHFLTTSGSPVYRFKTKANAVKLRVEITSGVGTIYTLDEDIKAIHAYIGVDLLYLSPAINSIPAPGKHVAIMSREVMDGGYLPDYWINYLISKSKEINEKNDAIGSHGFSFAFITDEHLPANYCHSPKILKYIMEHTALTRCISGGDILNDHTSKDAALDYIRLWLRLTKGLNIRNMRGNHDINTMQSDPTAFLDDDILYANMIRPIENKVTVSDGHLYYYEKIESQKVIIFYLDTGDMTTPGLVDINEQISWMNGIIQTLDSSWSVLVMQHVIFEGTADNPYLTTMGSDVINYLNTVTGPKIVALIGGHAHYDYADTSNSFPVILTTTDSVLLRSGTEGTVTEQAFDVFHIDTLNKMIYATRIGDGSNRQWSYT